MIFSDTPVPEMPAPETPPNFDAEALEEGPRRSLSALWQNLATVIALAFSIFNILALMVFAVGPWIHLPICLSFASVLTILLFKGPWEKQKIGKLEAALNVLLAVLVVASLLYYSVEYKKLIMRVVAFPKPLDIFFSSVLIFASLEITRRVSGPSLAIVGTVFLLYVFFGQYLPGELGHGGFRYARIVTYLYSDTGIFGSALEASCTFVFLFILFGEFLNRFGGGDVFIQLATGLAGQYRGGPAKVAVVSSALFGTIAGSAISNVVATGTFTIPLMKKIGYRAEFAGGVEAAASTGGQIMPPVMGSTAFILAEIVGVSYSVVAFKSMLPAILYFFSVFVMVDCEAIRSNLKGIPKSELPSVKETLLRKWPFLLPVLTIFVALLMLRVSTSRAAMYGIITAFAVPLLTRGLIVRPVDFLTALSAGAIATLNIIASCTAAGIVIGSLALTGLGLKLGNFLIYLSGGNLFLMLVAAMVLSIILGMGLPTAPAYIIASSVVAPALTAAGLPMLTAHLFIFYFSLLAMVTPPVALASYTAAGIAKAPPAAVGWEGFKMTFAAFIVPYMFVYSPAILMEGSLPTVAWATLTSVVGIVFLGSAIQGYFFGKLFFLQRAFLFGAALMTIHSGLLTDLAGVFLFAVAILCFRTQREEITAWLRRKFPARH